MFEMEQKQDVKNPQSIDLGHGIYENIFRGSLSHSEFHQTTLKSKTGGIPKFQKWLIGENFGIALEEYPEIW